VASGVCLNRFLYDRKCEKQLRSTCSLHLRLEDLHQRVQRLLLGLRSTESQELLGALQQPMSAQPSPYFLSATHLEHRLRLDEIPVHVCVCPIERLLPGIHYTGYSGNTFPNNDFRVTTSPCVIFPARSRAWNGWVIPQPDKGAQGSAIACHVSKVFGRMQTQTASQTRPGQVYNRLFHTPQQPSCLSLHDHT
jgi:hypothetical protein